MPTRWEKRGGKELAGFLVEHSAKGSALTPESLLLFFLWSMLTDCPETPVFTLSLRKK